MKNTRYRVQALCGAVFLLSALITQPALAEPGRLLASQCAQCHGTNGGGPGFDSIAGEGASELYKDLREMKARPVESIMDRQARGYTDYQLQLISNYLSTQVGGGDD